MKTQPFQQPNPTTRPTNMRRFQAPILGLILLVTVVASLVYAMRGNEAQSQLARPVVAQPARDAATQGVQSYLQAHASVGSIISTDAATRGVNSYVQAHTNVVKVVAVDPAVAGVTSYLNAHRAAKTQQVDAATQGLNGYLRAHANLTDTSAVEAAVAGVNGYLRAHGIVLISR